MSQYKDWLPRLSLILFHIWSSANTLHPLLYIYHSDQSPNIITDVLINSGIE